LKTSDSFQPGPRGTSSRRGLFGEYADSLRFDLCFQGFGQELATMETEYGPASGSLLLAFAAEELAKNSGDATRDFWLSGLG
jgi:hypothetical protein